MAAIHKPVAVWVSVITSLVLAAGLTGCSGQHLSAPPIKVASAYVMLLSGSGDVDAYLVIQNSGAADRLLTARSSAGGTVILRGLTSPGPTIRTVSALRIPGRSIVRLAPTGIHLVITQSGPMHQGTDVTLTLVFAHAGTVRVAAEVTNPQRGGNTYFGP
jgi:copper(I)-binding protein